MIDSGAPGRRRRVTCPRVDASPRLPDVGLIAVVPNDWRTYWQPRHQVLSRLTRYFHVGWVTPPPHWRARHRGERHHEGAFTDPPAGMIVRDRRSGPPMVHKPRWLADLGLAARVRRVRRTLLGQGCRTIVLQLWRPEYRRSVDPRRYALTCYYIDDEYSFAAGDLPMDPEEESLIHEVDHVFIHSPGLLEKKGSINPNTSFAPNGVDYLAWATPAPEPEPLRSIPRPRIAYLGVLKPTLDWSLLRALALLRPDWSFVLVGPAREMPQVTSGIALVSSLPNVDVLPAVPPEALPAYAQHSDVCIMPYSMDTHSARYGYPLKLHEYLATGGPVIGTPLRTVREFEDVVFLAEGEAEWAAAIENALAGEENTEDRRASRQAVACRHDWDLLVERIADTLVGRLGPAFQARLADAGAPVQGPDSAALR